ncbi:MAG: hypothetical protein DCF32_08320 [Leptolyngbya sp.]|nr:MAG: hypothetical protein DCF32_08320 [Leptolyngbya sp.]
MLGRKIADFGIASFATDNPVLGAQNCLAIAGNWTESVTRKLPSNNILAGASDQAQCLIQSKL